MILYLVLPDGRLSQAGYFTNVAAAVTELRFHYRHELACAPEVQAWWPADMMTTQIENNDYRLVFEYLPLLARPGGDVIAYLGRHSRLHQERP